MKIRRSLALYLMILLAPTLLIAQSSSANITGQVADPSKAMISGAKITVINNNTNVRYEGETNETGTYLIPSIPPGDYRIQVEKYGFRTIIKPNVILHVQDTVELNFDMGIGSQSETMTVEAGAPLVNTQDASVGTLIDRNFVGNLPLNGRSFQSLILLNPGVVATNSGSGASAGSGPGEFSVNGQRTNTNYFTVDGVSANTGMATVGFGLYAGGALPGNTALGTTSSLVPVDALEEFRVQTSTYSAEFGRQPGGQVQLVTRSGGNQFHGSAFESVRNDVLDAQDWFNSQLKKQNPKFQRPALRMNDFGGTFSGPILKDKTFFFFSYEGQRLRVPVTSSQLAYVPTLGLRQAASPDMQPFLNAFPLPNGPEIQVLEQPYKRYDPDPSSSTYNPYEPSGFASLSGGFSNPSSVNTYSVRLDQSLGNKLKLFGRYSMTPSNSLSRFTLNYLGGTISKNQAATFGANLVITDRLSSEFRANYSSSSGDSSLSIDSSGGATPITAQKMTAPYTGLGPLRGAFSLNGLNPTSYYNVGDATVNAQHQWNVIDNFSSVVGRHSIREGIDWRHLTPVLEPTAYNEGIAFNPPSPYYYSQYLNMIETGMGATISISSNQQVKPVFDDLSLYIDDTWKMTSRLTLTPGMRWEINPAPHDANGIMPIMITGINGTDTSGAALAPSGTPFYKTDYKAFSPRIGAAYQLRQTNGSETVIRGGFGVFYDLGSELALSGFQTYPFQSSTTLTNVTLPLSPSQAQRPAFPADPANVTLPLHHGALWAFNPDLTLPYTLQWNVGLEQALGKHQLVTLAYVAAAGRKLTSTYNLNNIPSTAILVGDSNQYRANPNFDNILYGANTSTSDYGSLQLQYQRRLSHGLQALASYTWSHSIDDLSYSGSRSGAFARGNSDFDVRHNLSMAISYDTPHINQAVLGQIVNGWSLDPIFMARTGVPLDVTAASEVLTNGMLTTIRPDVVSGQPMWLDDPGAPGGQKLNLNAFAFPSYTIVHTNPSCTNPFCYTDIYQQGNLARNSIRLPGIYQLNLGIGRQVSLSEKITLHAKGEIFNVFNHPMFGTYSGSWFPGNTSFGLPTQMLSTAYAGNLGSGSTALNSLFQNGGPRSIQLSLRLNF